MERAEVQAWAVMADRRVGVMGCEVCVRGVVGYRLELRVRLD